MRRGVVILLVLLLIATQYRLWLGSGGLLRIFQLNDLVEEQQLENFQLLERNLSLEPEVRDLKYGLESIEERARTELGMIKEGETFFQVVDGSSP